MSDERRRSADERAAPNPDDRLPDLDEQVVGVIDEYMGHFVPKPEETAGIRERILDLVRNDLYRGPSTRLVTGEGHEFAIASAAVRAIIREAVDSVDGIRARSVSVEPAGDPEGSTAEVSLTVTMRAGVAIVEASDLIRSAISERLISELGVPSARIDIEVEDAYVE